MPTTTPYMTSNDLIASVQRKISMPLSQITFSQLDVLQFANEEMFIAQVPSVLQFHEEYFVTYKILPLQNNLSRYPIPDRATGMKLRDLFWQDNNGNLFEMTRITEHDKAFFQRNVGANQAIHKFYMEGNYVVLTPSVVNGPTGFLIMVFYLRPNQLVKNDRAAIIQGFNQTLTVNTSLIAPLDTITLSINQRLFTPGDSDFDSEPDDFPFSNFNIPIQTFTAVNSLGGTISSITPYSTISTLVTTSAPHQLSNGQTVVISGANSNPSINSTYNVEVISPTSFTIQTLTVVSGNAGSFTSPNQFLIGSTDNQTAGNLVNAINASNVILAATAPANIITFLFKNIYTIVTTSNPGGFLIPQTTIGIQFTSLPSTYTDSETNITDTLFINGSVIDFLKTNPGHQTYVYDITIPQNGITGTSIYLKQNALKVPTGTVNNAADTSPNPRNDPIQYVLADLQIGDYICLANESIIPQIPPDLHNGLAERTAARILAALGDQQGLQASMAKIQDIEARQGTLLDNRSEGTVQKVANHRSLLSYGKMGTIRRT